MADHQIKIIQLNLKKKKRNVARDIFMDLVQNTVQEIQGKSIGEEEILHLESKLQSMNTLFGSIWKFGIEFKSNFSEWGILTLLGWLNWQVKQIEIASKYFKDWFELTKIHLRKHQKMPNYPSFDADIRNYFQFLDQVFGKKEAIDVVDELLKLSKHYQDQNVNGCLFSIKAGLIRTEDINQSIDLLKRAVWLAENSDFPVTMAIAATNSNIYYRNMLDIAVSYRKEKKDYGRAMKWNLKIRKKLKNQMIHYVASQNFENPKVLDIWIECLLEFGTCFIDGFSDAKSAKYWLKEADDFLRKSVIVFSREAHSFYNGLLKNLYVKYKAILAMKDSTQEVKNIESKIQVLKRLEINYIERIPELYMKLFEDISGSPNLVIETKDKLYARAINDMVRIYSQQSLFLESASLTRKLSSYLRPFNGASKPDAYKIIAENLANGDYFYESIKFLEMFRKMMEDFDLRETNTQKIEIQSIWGHCLMSLRNYESALTCFKEITLQKGEFKDKARFQMGCCLLKMRKYADALRHFEKLDGAFPNDRGYENQNILCKWICLQQLQFDEKAGEEFFILMIILKQKGDNWITQLCEWFQYFFREYFDDFAWPLYGSLYSLDIEEKDEQNEEVIEKEMCQNWDLTSNSFYITGFFKNTILKAKKNLRTKVCK